MRMTNLVLLTTLMFAGRVFAEDCNFNWVLFNEDGSKPTKAQHAEKKQKETECKQRVADEKQQARNARDRLKKEFKVDASKMTNNEAIVRLNEEVQKRADARKAEEERQNEARDNARMKQADELMEKQNRMLKGAGYNIEGLMGESDEQADAAELQAYENMVKQGVAPKCKGKKGDALINCVDAELDK